MDDELYVEKQKVKEYVQKKKVCLDDGVNVSVEGIKARGQNSKANFDIDNVFVFIEEEVHIEKGSESINDSVQDFEKRFGRCLIGQ